MNITEVKEHPILFSSPMVQAIREDRKIQTRRVLKPQPVSVAKLSNPRYQKRGDLFVGPDLLPTTAKTNLVLAYAQSEAVTRCMGAVTFIEEFCPYGKCGDRLWVRETWAPRDASTLINRKQSEIFYRADGEFPDDGSWRPSIYMPRWASRLTLEIVTIRVERVQEITRGGAIAEGCPKEFSDTHDSCQWYRDLWDSINGKRKGCAWNDNPWVWVLEFRRIKP